MKKLTAVLAALLTAFAVCSAHALELTADTVTPFSRNRIVIRSEAAGRLTVTPALPDFDLKDAVTAMPVQACWQKKVDEDYQNRK